jgi:ABC-type transporter Mla MlaB component
MLKISEAATPNHSVTLKLEGRIVGPWVEELRRICELFLVENRSLKLDLAEVSYADAAGVATLNDFKARGVSLKNCSPFVEQQIKTAG